MSRTRTAAHLPRTRNLAAARWEAACPCGWRRVLRWCLSARDAAAGHALDVTR